LTESDRFAARRRVGAPRTGLVLSVRGRRAVVMLPGGEVHRIKLDTGGTLVGDEIVLPASFGAARPWSLRRRPFALVAAATAVALLVVFALTAVPLPAVAQVSVDINPSMTLAVDRLLRVVEVVDCDELAAQLLAGVDARGRALGEVVALLASRAAGFLPAEQEYWLVLGVSPTEAGETVGDWVAPQLERVKTRAVAAWGLVRGEGGSPLQSTVVPMPYEVAAAARAADIGPGRYALLLAAEAAGIDVGSLDSLQTAAVVAAIKESGQTPGEVFRRADSVSNVEKLWHEQGDKVKQAQDKQPPSGKPVSPGSSGKAGKSGTP